MSALDRGHRFDQYEIVDVLGQGGFGITYRAMDHASGQVVAIKEYFPRSASLRDVDGTVLVPSAKLEQTFRWGLARFEEEARTLARFAHPHIVRVLRIFGFGGTAYIVLEFVDGQSLEQWVERTPRLPTQDEFDSFSSALLDALETMHHNDILHRDVAPKNILLRSDGSPVLIDFGSARQTSTSLDKGLTAIVTPNYAPYEQYMTSGQGQGPWTDVYGAAATLYRILMGRPPTEAPSRAMDESTYEPVAGAVSGEFRAGFLDAIDWGLATHPRNRPQSIAEWRQPLLFGMGVEGRVRGLNTDMRLRQREGRGLLQRLKGSMGWK
jgi:serine/threonine protein kinase